MKNFHFPHVHWREYASDVIARLHVGIHSKGGYRGTPCCFLISPKYRLGAMVIPKNASTLVHTIFSKLNDSYCAGLTNPQVRQLNNPYYFFPEKAREPEYRLYSLFTVARNPWDRLVSCYQHRVVWVREQLEKRNLEKESKFETEKTSRDGSLRQLPDYVKEVFLGRYPGVDFSTMSFSEFVCFVADVFSQNKRIDEHFMPQYRYVFARRPDFVLHFEQLKKGLYDMFDQLGLPRTILEETISNRYNFSDRKPYMEYYDDKTKKIVARVYARDIELFGYQFGAGSDAPPHPQTELK